MYSYLMTRDIFIFIGIFIGIRKLPDKKVKIKLKFLEKNTRCNPIDAKIKKGDFDISHQLEPSENLPLNFNIHISCSLDNHLMNHEAI